MSHYARLAALGFRFLAVAALIYSIPGFFMVLSVAGMPGMQSQMPMWPMAGIFIYPVLAVALFLGARQLGEIVARGLE